VDSGQLDAFESVVQKNVEILKKTGAKKIVTSCACCHHVLKFRYPEIVKDFDMEVFHSTEIFSDLVEEGKIKPEKAMSGVLTYQDPCHLTRLNTPGEHVFDAPRKLINSIPDIEFVELEGVGEYTQCCGRNPVELPELSLHTGINRIKDAQAVQANTLVTACSFCDWNLDRAAKDCDAGIDVLDVTVMLADSVGV
jgi:Fe-S oxidoreductase